VKSLLFYYNRKFARSPKKWSNRSISICFKGMNSIMTIQCLNKVTGISLAILLAMAFQAEAAYAAPAASGTVGAVVNRVTTAFSTFPNILSTAAYLLGLFYAVSGIFHFKDHVDRPPGTMGQAANTLSAGVKRFLAGGMLLSLPYMASATKGTLLGSGGEGLKHTGRHTATGEGMDAMIVKLVSNLYEPMTTMLTAFSYIAAIALLVVGITRLTKTAQEGPRGPGGFGTLMTFLAAGVLFAFGDMMGTFASSLFGDATVNTRVSISPDVISDPEDADRISAVVEALMAFITVVGFIAFIRGWFVLKAFADGGNGNATLAQALTFLFGGALAINLGELINVLQNTVGISGITFI